MPQVVNVPQGSSSTQQVPLPNDLNWGAYSSSLLIALAQVTFPSQGGSLILTGDVNFGPNYGFILKYLTTETILPATTGVLRLANTDVICWRNGTNSGNNTLGVNSSNVLLFNGAPLNVGSVTSIGVSGSDFTITGSPVTTSGTINLTLNTVNSNVGTFGDSIHLSSFTVNGKGLITAASQSLISFPVTSVFGRTGIVVAATNDYSFAQISGTLILTTQVSGILPVANGGTGIATTPTNGQVLVGNGTNYTVATIASGSGISTNVGAGTLQINNTGVLSSRLNDGSTTPIYTTSPTSATTGPVSHTITLNTQNANKIFAGPTTGAAAQPTFRSLVNADLNGTAPGSNTDIIFNSSGNFAATNEFRWDGTNNLTFGSAPSLGPSTTFNVLANGSLTLTTNVGADGGGVASQDAGNISFIGGNGTHQLSKAGDVILTSGTQTIPGGGSSSQVRAGNITITAVPTQWPAGQAGVDLGGKVSISGNISITGEAFTAVPIIETVARYAFSSSDSSSSGSFPYTYFIPTFSATKTFADGQTFKSTVFGTYNGTGTNSVTISITLTPQAGSTTLVGVVTSTTATTSGAVGFCLEMWSTYIAASNKFVSWGRISNDGTTGITNKAVYIQGQNTYALPAFTPGSLTAPIGNTLFKSALVLSSTASAGTLTLLFASITPA